MSFNVESLAAQLASLSSGDKLVVALSGGLDSSVLLHALCSLQFDNGAGFSLRAIHVNHGLSANATIWQGFCQRLCDVSGVALHVAQVQVNGGGASNLESEARKCRYEVFERELGTDECLVMGHHLDDQAETFLLRSLRGSGPRGLAAIPLHRPIGRGRLIRPLLRFSRLDLLVYAQAHNIEWVDDESNENLQFDRNFCRHQILPVLASRWPAYRESWARSALLCAEADALLDDLAALDYQRIQGKVGTVLSLKLLHGLNEPRQRNVLRYWLQQAGAPDPGWNVLNGIVSELIPAAQGSQPEIRWSEAGLEVVLRRYRGNLYLQKVIQKKLESDFLPEEVLAWSPQEVLHLPANGCLYALAVEGQGLRLREGETLSLRYRQGGEVCRLEGRRMRPLKKILQDAGIEPWLRDRLPLVYIADELVCIPGLGVCAGRGAGSAESGWQLVWIPPDNSPRI